MDFHDHPQRRLAGPSYSRYGATTGNLNFRGEPMPGFHELPDTIQQAWANSMDMPVEEVNDLLRSKDQAYRNAVSDGYHTFLELYAHRIQLFISLCKVLMAGHPAGMVDPFDAPEVWRSMFYSDGNLVGEGQWFLLGINKQAGRQITYHLPMSDWDRTDFVETLNRAPDFDGHTPAEALQRLALYF